MPDLKTRILEIEADDDIGRLARALEAVLDCVVDMEQDNGDGGAYSTGIQDMAGTVRHIISDQMEGDDVT